jgi:small-conductance mechanosensitive channel/CRP-like cAMP-binding protein
MEDLPSLRDALLIAGVVAGAYLVLIAAAQILRRTRLLRLGWTFHAFAIVLGLLVGIGVSGWRSEMQADIARSVTACVVILGSFPVITIINRIFWPAGRKGKPMRGETPRMLADATGLVVIVIAVVIVLHFVYKKEVPGLLAGSGVVAIIIGLAMQDLLGNLFAGFSIYFEKSFQTGDWLLLNNVHARVIEISWRATRLLTLDDVLIDVPNSEIVKGTVTNFELPTPRHAVRALIGLHYDIPPAQVQRVLKEAAASVDGICPDSPPVVYVKDFADSAIVYEIKVWIDDHSIMARVLSEVRSHCWYAVRRAGMEIPYPQLTIHRSRPGVDASAARAEAAATLRAHPIFGFLSVGQVEALVRKSPVLLFARDERIIEQGAAGESMFLIVRGNVDVQIVHNQTTSVVAALGPGDCIGEMSVLTGDARTATVVARSEVEAVEICRASFASLVRENPDVVTRLTELLTQRQLANEKVAVGTETSAKQAATRATIMHKLRSFFQLGD